LLFYFQIYQKHSHSTTTKQMVKLLAFAICENLIIISIHLELEKESWKVLYYMVKDFSNTFTHFILYIIPLFTNNEKFEDTNYFIFELFVRSTSHN